MKLLKQIGTGNWRDLRVGSNSNLLSPSQVPARNCLSFQLNMAGLRGPNQEYSSGLVSGRRPPYPEIPARLPKSAVSCRQKCILLRFLILTHVEFQQYVDRKKSEQGRENHGLSPQNRIIQSTFECQVGMHTLIKAFELNRRTTISWIRSLNRHCNKKYRFL